MPSSRTAPGDWSDATLCEEAIASGRLNEMISGVAHGVKNQLGILLMGTEYLERKVPEGNAAAVRVVDDMRTAIDRTNAIMRALLQLSLVENPNPSGPCDQHPAQPNP